MARARYDDQLPSRARIFEFWKDRIEGLVRPIYWGEPACWACRFHYGFKYDVKRSDASWDQILRCWDRIPLQRCHIVGRSLGGSDDVSNLFLLCRECHDRMPNTNIPEIFYEWARAQSWSRREDEKILDAMKAFGVEDAMAPDLEQVLESEDYKVWSEDRRGLHWPQSNYASISSRLTPATTLGLAVYYLRLVKNHPSGNEAKAAQESTPREVQSGYLEIWPVSY
ncbi:HNH endonuclease [Bradyrhizobium huanghuaihaiense]|uniref:HNH endonuclease n=2 Tax=Bradyrhizobium huanghuaihaiense TaxID=990078 RepID=A0A562RRX8_9BRAD|nr:HNH endonuclease [Bradyrhizobium huanghuaihaiense]TWI71861.1 HNH endonuclease [Bradyrhizobium huanghuaihaiense]